MLLRKENWLDATLGLLLENGNGSFSIDLLCKKLQVSKGSFYHHFKNRDDLVKKVLHKWELENTLKVIELTEKVKQSPKKLKVLTILTGKLSNRYEQAMRAWARYEDAAKSAVAKVDKMRMDFIREAFLQTSANEKEARRKALHIYVIFIGARFIEPALSEKETNELYIDASSHYR